MLLTNKVTLTIAGLWFVAFTAFAARPSPIMQLFSMLLTFGLLVMGCLCFVLVFTRWRRERWQTLVPIAACVLAVVFAPKVGAAIRHFTFQRALPSYEAVIRQMEAGSISVSPELLRIPQAEGSLAYAVLAQRSTNGVLTVEFLTGGGFPAKHSGYLYCSSGVIEKDSLADSRWPIRQAMRPLWYQISD